MRHKEQAVARLNDLLRTELGVGETGEPMYQWRHTGDLVDVFAVHDKDGKPVKELHQLPSGIWAARTKTIRRLQAETRQPVEGRKPINLWAICYWEASVSPEEWVRIYGTLEDYPAHGSYFIGDTIHWSGAPPTLKTTTQFIDGVREHRRKALAEHVAAAKAAEDKIQKEGDDLIGDFAEDKLTAFLNPTPGKRGGSVSFGGTNKEILNGKTVLPAA